MSISPVPPVNSTGQTDSIKIADEPVNTVNKTPPAITVPDEETKHAFDHASGLLQTIISDKLSDKIIRKMPSDEYLHLLSLLDEIISGSIDKRV